MNITPADLSPTDRVTYVLAVGLAAKAQADAVKAREHAEVLADAADVADLEAERAEDVAQRAAQELWRVRCALGV